MLVQFSARLGSCCGGSWCAALPTLLRSDDIVRWIKKRTGPATVEVADVEALEKAQKDNKVGAACWKLNCELFFGAC